RWPASSMRCSRVMRHARSHGRGISRDNQLPSSRGDALMTTPMLADRPALYQAARRFVDEGLRRDGCLFEPGRPVWRVDVIDDFHERYVVKFDDGSETFRDKLVKQLAGASADVAQYAGELL